MVTSEPPHQSKGTYHQRPNKSGLNTTCWLVVWNHGILWLSIYWECHDPKWPTLPGFGSCFCKKMLGAPHVGLSFSVYTYIYIICNIIYIYYIAWFWVKPLFLNIKAYVFNNQPPMFDAERPPFFRGLRSLLGSLFIDSKTSLFWGEMRWNSFEWMGMGEWDDYW